MLSHETKNQSLPIAYSTGSSAFSHNRDYTGLLQPFPDTGQRDLALYTRLLADTGVFQSAYAGTEDVNAYVENGTILRTSAQASSITNVFISSLPVIIGLCSFFLVICIILGHFLSLQLLMPLNIMAEHLDSPIKTPVYRELKPFADKIRAQHENILKAASVRQDFTANISHELKTPLTTISGYAELIENGMVSSDQIPHIVKQIHHNSNRLLSHQRHHTPVRD